MCKNDSSSGTYKIFWSLSSLQHTVRPSLTVLMMFEWEMTYSQLYFILCGDGFFHVIF